MATRTRFRYRGIPTDQIPSPRDPNSVARVHREKTPQEEAAANAAFFDEWGFHADYVVGCPCETCTEERERRASAPSTAPAPPAPTQSKTRTPAKKRTPKRPRAGVTAAEHHDRAERAREGVGGASPPELADAAKRDGSTFVGGSQRARAHVRAAPPKSAPAHQGPTLSSAPSAVYGRPADALVSTAEGAARELVARFAVVEIDELIPSHDPKTWARRPDYPEGAQERDYSRDAAERLKVETIAAKLAPVWMLNTNPDALNGPPVVDTVGVVVGGNGRTMGLTLAYQRERAAAYRALLVERAPVFGFEAVAIDPFRAPVLVRVAFITPAERGDLSRRLNEGQTQVKRASVDAASLSGRLSASTLAALPEETSSTMRAFLRTAAARAFIDGLIIDDVIERRNVSLYLDSGGGLSEDGATLAERVLVAWAIPDAATVEALGPARVDLLAKVVPALAAAGRAGHDLAGVVREAAEQIREAEARGLGVEALASQGGLFGARETRPAVLTVAAPLEARSPRFASIVRAAAARAVSRPAGQADMFGPAPTIDQVVAEVADA